MAIYSEMLRLWRLLRVISILAKCRVWMLYVRDPLKLFLIEVLHDGSLLAYSLLKYRWMPAYKRGRWTEGAQ